MSGRGRVSLFVTCVVDQLFPSAGLAMADVLEGLGYDVAFPPQQTCCGQPAFNSGYPNQAREVALQFLEVFRDAGHDADHIVVPSGSCTAMISHHFADLNLNPPRVWEFSQFLLEVARVEDVGARFDGVVTFHDSCHALRELHIKQGPRRLLGKVRGLTLKEMSIPEECCGFGGMFSVKFSEISQGMTRTKIASIVETGASAVVALDASCLMQLQGALRRDGHSVRTMHLAEVLASR